MAWRDHLEKRGKWVIEVFLVQKEWMAQWETWDHRDHKE